MLGALPKQDENISAWQNGSWDGIVERSARANTNWSKGSSVSMRTPREAGKRSEEHLPNLLSNLTAIVDGQSQADPQFRTNRLYTRLTATEARRVCFPFRLDHAFWDSGCRGRSSWSLDA
jgi:hypothetical protein